MNFNESLEAIYIKDHLNNNLRKESEQIPHDHIAATVAKFEIFESSSDDELSQGAFESAA